MISGIERIGFVTYRNRWLSLISYYSKVCQQIGPIENESHRMRSRTLDHDKCITEDFERNSRQLISYRIGLTNLTWDIFSTQLRKTPAARFA